MMIGVEKRLVVTVLVFFGCSWVGRAFSSKKVSQPWKKSIWCLAKKDPDRDEDWLDILGGAAAKKRRESSGASLGTTAALFIERASKDPETSAPGHERIPSRPGKGPGQKAAAAEVKPLIGTK